MILALGDSITEFAIHEGGWWRGFAGDYSRRADVLNRGLAGYSSDWALAAADEAADAFSGRLAAVLIWFGANDAKTPGTGGPKQSVPLDEFGDNLRAIVRKFRKAAEEQPGKERRPRWPVPEQGAGGPVLVLVTPSPVHEQMWLNRLATRAESEGQQAPQQSDRLNARLAEYAEVVRRVAAEVAREGQQQEGASAVAAGAASSSSMVMVADVHRAFVDAGADKGDDAARRFFADGLHLSAEGSTLALGAIRMALAATPAAPDALPYHLPTYAQIDADDPGRTFGPLGARGWGP
jgi:lysophospholipase L1-like esterase